MEIGSGRNGWQKASFFLLFFISVVLFGAVLMLMADVLKPIVLSVMLSFVFLPLIERLNKRLRVPWGVAIALAIFISAGVFAGIGSIVWKGLQSIFSSAQEYQEKFTSIARSVSEAFKKNSSSAIFSIIDFDEEQTLFENIQNALNIGTILKSMAVNLTGGILSFSKTAFFVLLFSIFMLAELKATAGKINSAFGKNSGRAKEILKNTAQEVTSYLSIKFSMSVLTGVLVFIDCVAFGMNFSVVWAFLSFAMNFIPTFGSLLAWAVTTLFAVIQFYPSPVPILTLSLLVIAENVVIGNVLEPKITGKNLNLSPFVILASLSVWGWIWGFLGMLLAVPFTVTIKIVCENVDFLKPVAILLGSGVKNQERTHGFAEV